MKKQFRVSISLILIFTLLAMNMPAYAFAQSAKVGYINTVAGNGTRGYSGDGGPATAAEFYLPNSVAVDASGNLYIVDLANYVIREVAAETHTQWGIAMTAGFVYTVAGNGTMGYSGDGNPATKTGIGMPECIAVDNSGNLFITDQSQGRILELAAETHTQWGIAMTAGYIYTVAGGGSNTGNNYFFGAVENVAATEAKISPTGVAVDTAGNLYIAALASNMIYEVAAADGTQRGIAMKAGKIYTVAGTGVNGYSGDGGPAISAQLFSPESVAVDTFGNLYIADDHSNVIRKVDGSGLITTVAGCGKGGYSGDGGPATAAKLGIDFYGGQFNVAVDASGNLYITDFNNFVVREVAAATGMQWGISMTEGYIYTVAGNGTRGYSGDGGPATSAEVVPTGVAVDTAGNLYIVDGVDNNCIREVTTSLPLSAAAALTSLPAGTVNSNYDSGAITQYVSVSGGTMPFTWSAEGLPAGLSMSSDGRITGTSNFPFSGSITVTVTDSNAPTAYTARVSLPMTVSPAPPVIDPDGGTYDSPQTVNVNISASLSAGQSIYYTTDNTTPAATSDVYTAPFPLTLTSGDTTVKACVYDTGTGLWSSQISAVFKVSTTLAPPIIPTPTAMPGTTRGTTKIIVTSPNNKDDTLAVAVSTNSIAIPNLGDNLPSGDNVVNPYLSGSNLSVDASDYVGIFELDSSGKVAAFSQLKLSADEILTPSGNVTLSPNTSRAGRSRAVFVYVATSNVTDGQSVAACLTDGGKNILGSVALAEGQIHDNAASLSLNLPCTLPGGAYYVSVTVPDLPSIYTPYTILSPPPPPPVKKIAAPAVSTGNATGITGYQAILNGSIIDDGGEICSQISFIFRKQGDSNWQSTAVQSVSVVSGSQFSATITGLSQHTTYEYAARAANSAGPGRGQISTFTTANLPTVTTQTLTSLDSGKITFNGSITDDGGRPITDCGFIIGPSSAWRNYNGGTPSLTGTTKHSVSPGGDGSFAATLPISDGTWSYLAYATNTGGTSYGSLISFRAPLLIVTTMKATDVGSHTATIYGSVTGGNGMVKNCGFQWGTDPGNLQQVTAVAGQDGSFSINLTALQPSTQYIFRAYATDAIGDLSGNLLNFTTLTDAPVVETMTISGLAKTEATLNGSIVNDNDLPITDSGFLWGLTPYLGTTVHVPAGSDGHTLSDNLSGLAGNTTYYVRAYAVNSAGTGYGNILSFTTQPLVPEVMTQAATPVRDRVVELNGFIKEDYGLPITASGFLWGLSPQPDGKLVCSPGSGSRTLTNILGDLEGGTTYYVRAYAANSNGYGLGDVMSFTTPVFAPTVNTTSAVFDIAAYTLSLKGNISSNGGALLAGYGFRYNVDGVNWTTLMLGQGNYTGDIAVSVDGQKSGLAPGTTYYVQAFASNTAGTTYGGTVKFTTPGLPKLTAGIDKSSITTTIATVNGTITNTGGPDIPITAYRFRYRQEGSPDWLVADYTQGSFGKESFTFQLDGLTPGTKYEFEAQACSIVGWGSSPLVSFAARWGNTDKEVAVNMKAAGYGADAIATAIKSTFGDSDATAFQVLQYAGFGLNDIADGLKNSLYKDSAAGVASVFYSSGISAETTTGMLQQVFQSDMAILSFGYPKPGPAPYGVAITLYKSDYKLDDIIIGLKTDYNFQPADFMNSRGLDLTASPFSYSSDEIYSAFARIFGTDTLARYLWNEWNRSSDANTNWTLYSIAVVLKNDAGVGSALKIAELLKSVDPLMSRAQLAGSLERAGYSASDAGAALMQVYSAADLQAIVFALLNNTYGPYDTASIEDFMVKGLNCSAQQFVQVITAIDVNGHGSVWVLPEKIPGLLASYYQLNAQEAARTMYAAGYTEAQNGTQYGMTYMIYALMDYYHPTSFYGLIGIIKGCGASPLAVAQEMQSLSSQIMTGDWLTAYQQQGYTAIDAAAWCASTGKDHSGDIGITIYRLLPAYYTARNSTQTSLNDIAVAIKTVYNPDAATALNHFENVNQSYSLGLADSAIQNAVTYAYQTDALWVIVQTMKNAGDPAVQVAHTLYNDFGIKDQMKMAGYLAKAGYGVGDVIAALDNVFYNNNHDSKAAIDALSLVGQGIFPQNPPSLGFILRSIGCSTASSAVRTLYEDSYTVEDMATVMKDDYSRTVLQALEDITGILGSDKQLQITSAVLSAYGLDVVGFAQFLKNSGYSAALALRALKIQCGISDLGILASYMNQAGYSEFDTLTALTPPEIDMQGTTWPGHLNTQLATAVSDAYANDAVLVYLQHWRGLGLAAYHAVEEIKLSGITDLDKQVSYLKIIGYGVLDSFYAMRQANHGSQLKDIIAAIAAAYRKGPVMMSILIWQSQGVKYPEQIYGLLEEVMGITDPVQRFNYMKEAGYSESDAFAGVVRYSRSDFVKVLVKVYGLSDPVAVGSQFRQLPHQVSRNYNMENLASMLKQAFPGISNVALVKTFLAAGFKVYDKNSANINSYLYFHLYGGQKDDALAAILGTGSEDSLGLEWNDAATLIYFMGYDLKDAVALLLKDNYTWPQIFFFIRGAYGSYKQDPAYGEWDSNAISILKVLMDTYDFADLVNGDLHSYYPDQTTVSTSDYYATYCDLIEVGYAQEDVIRAMLKAGASLTGLFGVAYVPTKPAADIANVFWNVATTNTWVKVKEQPYDANISVLDIARAMMNANSDDGQKFQDYTLLNTFDAMKSVADRYMQAIKVSDIPSNVAALLIMREAGMSADDAASCTAYEAGSKHYSIWDAFFNGPNPISAMGELVQAGYGKNESISAVWNNSSWNLAIKFQLSAMLNIAANSEELAEDATIFERIVAAIAPDIEQGTMVTQVGKMGIATGLFKIVSNAINLGNAMNSDKASLIVISGLTPDMTSPQKTGTAITWTCTTIGGISGNLEYKFWVVPKSDSMKAVMGALSPDQMGRDYGKSNTFTWQPKAAGDYIIIVWVRDKTSADTEVKSAPAGFTLY